MTIFYASPIIVDQKVVGVLVAAESLETISKEVTSLVWGESGYAYLIDKSGVLVAHPVTDLLGKLSLTVESERVSSELANGDARRPDGKSRKSGVLLQRQKPDERLRPRFLYGVARRRDDADAGVPCAGACHPECDLDRGRGDRARRRAGFSLGGEQHRQTGQGSGGENGRRLQGRSDLDDRTEERYEGDHPSCRRGEFDDYDRLRLHPRDSGDSAARAGESGRFERGRRGVNRRDRGSARDHGEDERADGERRSGGRGDERGRRGGRLRSASGRRKPHPRRAKVQRRFPMPRRRAATPWRRWPS